MHGTGGGHFLNHWLIAVSGSMGVDERPIRPFRRVSERAEATRHQIRSVRDLIEFMLTGVRPAMAAS